VRGNPGPWTLSGPGFGKIGNHQTAFIRATAAGLGAQAAMFQRVLGAFFRAHFADLGANPPNVIDHFAVAGHVCSCQTTDLRAVHIQLDTACHLVHILFRETGYGALITGIGAIVARLDAGSKLFMNHKTSIADCIQCLSGGQMFAD
jgi:hypothetical protein